MMIKENPLGLLWSFSKGLFKQKKVPNLLVESAVCLLTHLFISFLASHMFKRRIVNIVAALGEESQEAVAFQLSSGSLSLLIEFAHCDVVVRIRTYTLKEK